MCFGADAKNGGFAAGIWWGIVILLSVTMLLVGGIGWAFWTVESARREKDA